MLRESDDETTIPLCSHANEKLPRPIAEQKNATLSYKLTEWLLGIMLTIAGDTA